MKIAPASILIILSVVFMPFFMITPARAQGIIRADQKYIEAIKKSSEVTPLGVDSFGDNLDLSSGSETFKWTDIDVPGNSGLPVRLQRSLVVEDIFLSGANFGGFGAAGSLDIPYLMGVFSSSGGWQVYGGSPNARCSMYTSPPDYAVISSSDYWNGNWMHIPWAGDQAMLTSPASTLPKMSGGTAPIITKNFWTFKCTSSTKNGYPGEGFIAISPEGEKYYFDWVVTIPYSAFSKRYGNWAHSTSFLPRVAVYFLISRIEDRFGNWVSYAYTGSKLQKITSNDGRFIQVDSWNGNNIASVSSSVGTWSYAYGTNSMTTTQPDGSHWQFATTGNLLVTPTPSLPVYYGGGPPSCPAPEPSSGDYGLTVTQPSGAMASYTFTVMRHYRSNVPKMCNSFIDNNLMSYQYLTIPNFNDTFTLVSKSIMGSGLQNMQWTYNYNDHFSGFADSCVKYPDKLVCPTTKVTEVRGPNATYKRYTFGNMFNETSGQLMKVEEGYETGVAPNTQVIINKTTAYNYVLDSDLAGLPFPDKVGFSGSSYLDNSVMDMLRPLKLKQTTLDGRTFTNTVGSFDVFARPTQVTKSSAPSP